MKNRKLTNAIYFILIVFIVGLLSYSGAYGFDNVFGYRFKAFDETINKGLDLQGGVSVLEEIVSDEQIDDDTIARTIELLSMRINPDGVSEIAITKEGDKRIRIEIPGKYDVKEVVDTVGKTGELTFKDPEGNVLLTGKDVKKATAYIDDLGKAAVRLEMNDSGKEKFAQATEKFLGQSIGIYMDEEQLTNPVVQSIITQGESSITGNMSLDEAKRIANIINSGALPVTLKTVSAKTVGATLGANALPKSIDAAKIGIGLVLLFMILYYRVPGLLASIALVLYIVLVLGVFTSINATLTLSGIAGFLLTVGMAVDANVLIFERIKEELNTGKSVKSSVEAGLHRALSSILDSNITTVIAGIVLYSFGTGAVKGFALTLIIGIVVSVLTALIVTRYLLKIAINMGILNKKSYFGANFKLKNVLKVVEKSKIWISISLIIIIIGSGFMITKGLNYGIDFKGGTVININIGEKFNKSEIDNIIKKYDEDAITKIANEKEIEIRSNVLSESDIKPLFEEIKSEYNLQDTDLLGQESVGPTIGKELKRKALIALAIATVAMLIYIGFRFEFRFGAAAIVALIHDVMITLSVYAIFDIAINSSFIAAMLTIVGYSINDTIVIFDRIRENQKLMKRSDLKELTNTSITHTLTRSVNTALTTLFTIAAVYYFVPSIRDFAFPLIIGVISGCYSSIFIASPVWVKLKSKKKKITA